MATKPKTKAKARPKPKWREVLLALGPTILGGIVTAARQSGDNADKRKAVVDIALSTASTVLGVVGAATDKGLVTAVGVQVDALHSALKPILPKPVQSIEL